MLALAAGDPALARRLARDPRLAAEEAGVSLTPTEQRVLAATSASALCRNIDGVRLVLEDRRSFLREAGAAAGLAALVGGCEGPRAGSEPSPGPPRRPPDLGPPDVASPDTMPSGTSSMFFGELQVSNGRQGGGTGEGTMGLGSLGTITGSRPDVPRRRSTRGFAVRLTVGKPSVKGQLSREIIRRIVRRHQNELRYWFYKTMGSRPLPADLGLTFTINGKGHVAVAAAECSSRGPKHSKLEASITRAVRRWLFPKPRGGKSVGVKLTLTFRIRRAIE